MKLREKIRFLHIDLARRGWKTGKARVAWNAATWVDGDLWSLPVTVRGSKDGEERIFAWKLLVNSLDEEVVRTLNRSWVSLTTGETSYEREEGRG